jgi:hypothetical protein
MNSDNYEFSKSSMPQSTSAYSAYTDKQFNYINDINSGVYSNNSGLSLVTWDLTSIYNSAGFSDASDLYLAIPIVMCAACSSASQTVAAPTAGHGLVSLKSNYQHLIHQLEIVCNGKVCEQMQPFISVAKNFLLLSTMSATDLKSINVSLGVADTLDNERSVQWNTVAGTAAPGGVGLTNNRAFVSAATASSESPLFLSTAQNKGTTNSSIQRRNSRIVDTTKTSANSFNKIYGSNGGGATQPFIMSGQQLRQDLKPYYTVYGNVMTWYDVGLIPLKYISDFIDKLGLVKKLDLVIRAYFNTGTLAVPTTVTATGTDTFYGAFTSSTFSNTCPITVNLLADTTANGGLMYSATAADTTTYISAGLFLAKPPTTSIGAASVNLALGVDNHPIPACRCYYSQVKLDPARALSYVQENIEKQIVYEQVLFNQYTNIGAGNAFSQLIQSGIKNPVSVLIIPFIASTTNTRVDGAGSALGFSQYASPFDTSPSSFSPCSITNLQVTLGGVNILNSSLNYTYENFLSQVVNAESLTSSDIGVSTGIITQAWWESNRVYFVDLVRGRSADKEMARNLNISFNNNSLISIDLMVFTIYLDRVVINIETGQLRKA